MCIRDRFHPEPCAAQPAPSSPPEPPPGLLPAAGHTDAPQPDAGTLLDGVRSLACLLEERCEDLGE
eukprot:11698858-Alexandrium_andersonii.AAC.1